MDDAPNRSKPVVEHVTVELEMDVEERWTWADCGQRVASNPRAGLA